ncbi:MAG: glycogen debranching protein GlgX [Desulfobacterales bacterium]|nr:glycogen debranching protein GlgX [Desulfobacterales bacterium]
MKRKFHTATGAPLPFGATFTPAGLNFALFSRHAQAVSLVIFSGPHGGRRTEIPLDPKRNKTGDVWHILLCGIEDELYYAYRVHGPHDPHGQGHAFDRKALLLDPYARVLTGGEQWGRPLDNGSGRIAGFTRYCLAGRDQFDWQGDRPLNIPLKDSIIYELHVRGFTRDPSSGVSHPGTFAGIVDKIPYLRQLGITAVELMPITDFNELENIRVNPVTGEKLTNFWGYSPISFFAPKAAYAADNAPGNQVREFKKMVRALHRAGIEVILDVVFNHTAEGGADGPMISFRGLDNSIYYLLDSKTREYLNFSGCGNTLNCNHPLVRQLIIDCLHYWVVEMHVDGFRFDLASILGRDQSGRVLSNPPMVEIIAEDPILAHTKIIAEAWDAAGLYQVGSFSTSARWAEWNGHFRDDVRAFLCDRDNTVAALATRISGSADLYQRNARRPCNSINFVTSHDGFTLYDLVSYNRKHNQENGEDNRDGFDHNLSWNSGSEGQSDDPGIKTLRARRVRTLALILFISQGVPMLVAGDEFGRTQQGNNNAYCQDNPVSWLDWTLVEKNKDLLRFFRMLIALRKKHPLFRRDTFFPAAGKSSSDPIRWQAERPDVQDWSPAARALAFYLSGATRGQGTDDDFFVMLNGSRHAPRSFIPHPPRHKRTWRRIIDTAAAPPADILLEETGEIVAPDSRITVAPMAAVVLIGSRR